MRHPQQTTTNNKWKKAKGKGERERENENCAQNSFCSQQKNP